MEEELKTNEQNIDPTVNDGVMTNQQWETFAKGDLINFLIGHNLQKVTVDDGCGKKATVKIKSNGEYSVSYTSSEVM